MLAAWALAIVLSTGRSSAAVRMPLRPQRRAMAGHDVARAGARGESPDQGPPYTRADVQFMAGMIEHHAQAVLMAGWAPSHGAGDAVRRLCERIVVGQRDEIAFMQNWLRDRHEDVRDASPQGHMMAGMAQPPLMPGMLTQDQLAALDSARGPEFDRVFLTFMIQHHRGAITMVERLLAVPGAAQDGTVFRFAADVNADQTTEIDRMTRMLDAMSAGGRRP